MKFIVVVVLLAGLVLTGLLLIKARLEGNAKLQRRFVLAAEYGDSWTEARDGKGNLIGGLAPFFMHE
jgi:hypothetical protein